MNTGSSAVCYDSVVNTSTEQNELHSCIQIGFQFMAFDESAVRDSLAKNLTILEAGLRLEKKEKFIPNKYGTRGFIDLVAHDVAGRIVLIEVKKTRAAEREAIHEVLKYIEGVKRHLRLKEDEIRVLIVSPEWTELLVPFSSLVQRTTCDVSGYKLELSSSGDVLSAKHVEPIVLYGDRFIAPWHELRYYESAPKCQDAIEEYKSSCELKGIESFILLELHPNQENQAGISSPKQGTMRDLISGISGGQLEASGLPLYRRAIYFAMQQLSEKEYKFILDNNGHDASETYEYIESMENEEERLLTLHEAVLDMKPRVSSDFLEIGYPAKLSSRLLAEDGWEVSIVHRFGAFERNRSMLDDAKIVDEICGQGGANYQTFRKDFDPRKRSDVAEVEKGVKRCLSGNPAWERQIRTVLEEVSSLKDSQVAELKLYCPSTSLLTFYLIARNGSIESYAPGYSIYRKADDQDVLIFGDLVWDGSSATMKTVLRKHYDSSLLKLLSPLMWGGYDDLDAKVMNTIGFRYRTFRLLIDGDQQSFSTLTDEGWEPCKARQPYEDIVRFFEENAILAQEICDLYSERWNGGMVDLSGLN